MNVGTNIYLIYSKKDKDLANELKKALIALKREMLISNIWDRFEIQAGQNITDYTIEKIGNSDIVLLLISSDFIASKKCFEEDMEFARILSKEKKTHLISVLLRECLWENTEIASHKLLPKNGKSVKSSHWANIDLPYKEIVFSIRELILKIKDIKKQNFTLENSKEIFNKEYQLGIKYMDSGIWQKAVEHLESSFFYFHSSYHTNLSVLTSKIVQCNKEIGFKQKKELALKEYKAGNIKQAYKLSLFALKIKDNDELESIKNEYLKTNRINNYAKKMLYLIFIIFLMFFAGQNIRPFFFINQTILDEKIEPIKENLEKKIVNKKITNSWEMAQCIVSFGAVGGNEKKQYQNYIYDEKGDCLFWTEEQDDCGCDLQVNAWVIWGMALNSIPVEDTLIKEILKKQNEAGAWSITGTIDEIYGSVYVTSLLLISLNLVKETKSADLKIELKEAIDKGKSWLYKSASKSYTWRDYPKHFKGRDFRSISALVVHTLNTLNNGELKLFETNLKWIENLKNYTHNERLDKQSNIEYLKNGVYKHTDDTWHLDQPWEIIATISAYNDAHFYNKPLAMKHINNILENLNTENIDFEQNSFIQAEYLLSLRLLKEFCYTI